MGDGSWNTNTYASTTGARLASGTTFAYSGSMHTTPHRSRKAHTSLDPKTVNKAGAHADLNVREALDSDEHPTSRAVVVAFDVTGSMSRVPSELIAKLPQLLGAILRKGYLEHPQILFAGIGDATCDAVPIQVAQFESDNRLDEHLDKMFLEGGGGGQKTESYELMAYFLARKTHLDCLEKRGERGYLFIIGDEMNYPYVSRDHVKRFVNDDGLEADIPTKEIYHELQDRFDVFFILPQGTSYYGHPDVLDHWQGLLGKDRVIQLQDLDAVCETIAIAIGVAEGVTDLDGASADLKELGSSDAAIAAAGTALAPIAGGASARKTNETVTVDAPEDLDADDEDGLTKV